MYNLEDYFGINGDQLQAQTTSSSESPTPTYVAGPHPTGAAGTVGSLTDWRRSPVFWLAVFSIFALGMIHAEGRVALALK